MFDRLISFIYSLGIHLIIVLVIVLTVQQMSGQSLSEMVSSLVHTPEPEPVLAPKPLPEEKKLIEAKPKETLLLADISPNKSEKVEEPKKVEPEKPKVEEPAKQEETEEKARLEEEKRKLEEEKKQLEKEKLKTQKERKKLESEKLKAKEEAEKLVKDKHQKEEDAKREAKAKLKAEEMRKKEEQRKSKEEEKQRLAKEAEEQERLAKEAAAAEQQAREAAAGAARAAALKAKADAHQRRINEVMALIKARVQNVWKKPPSVQANLFCIIRIRLIPDGSVGKAEVIQSSGNAAFDSSALVAVRAAAPLPISVRENADVFDEFREFDFKFIPYN